MRRIISLLIIVVLSWTLFDDLLFAQKGSGQVEENPETKIIDLTADIVYPITLNDTVEVMCLVGNFAAQHNGAIITADSAVRYSDKRLECFGAVIINKNTTYAYADRADYNGDLNEVNLYAPIVKVVDGDATLYCYNFRFNTLDNIGSYVGGGVMINGESVMESVNGYYYSDTKELIGVGDVQLSGDEYEMTSDSIIYNTETEAAYYFANTNIWNEKDEYLYADEGDYDKIADRYSFSLNGYILTEEQEMWGDSMDYYRATEHIYMRNNIQIDDTTQKSLIFGDYGEYIKTPGDITLVGNPSIISYDKEQGDSLFMRADTFQIFTLNRFELSESLETSAVTSTEDVHDHDHDHDHEHIHEAPVQGKELNVRGGREFTPNGGGARPPIGAEALSDPNLPPLPEAAPQAAPPVDVQPPLEEDLIQTPDSLDGQGVEQVDSLVVDSLAMSSAVDTLNFWQRIKHNYQEKRKIRAAQKMEVDVAKKIVLDSIGRERQLVINAKLDAEKVREARRVAERQAKIAERETRKIRRDVERGKISAADSTEMISALAVDTAALINELLPVAPDIVDSIIVDSLHVDTIAIDSVAVDSLYRLTKGYRNVRIYRSDFQAVADSMATNSLDSIIRLYIDPILWHDNNQVTSDVMDIYSSNSQITKAIFTEGNPIVASEIEQNIYYNQIAGRVITSLFQDSNIYRTDVDGNAQTIYFMQEEDSNDVDGLMVMASASATFYIEEQNVVGITYRGDPDYTLYPMNMIPADQEYTLKGFSWQMERRPSQGDVFDRVIRPSVREEKSIIPRPTFPIHEELNAHRDELIESGLWRERNELVPPYAEEWMESLGFKTGQPREENER
ncbi:MAG: OstA-like protein [Rikenellaceae bacterium]